MVKMHKTYSLRTTAIGFLAVMIVVIFGCVYSISAYYTGLLKEQYYEKAADSLRFYTQERSNEVSSMETYLNRLLILDADISSLNKANTENDLYHAKMCVYNTFNDNIGMYPLAEGFFLYSPRTQVFTCYSGVSFDQTCYYQLKDFFEADGKAEYSFNFQNWTSLMVDDTLYFVRMIYADNGVIGAWINGSSLSGSLSKSFSENDSVCLLNANREVIGRSPYEDFVWTGDYSGDYALYRDPTENIQYLAVSRPFISKDCLILDLAPLYMIDRQLSPVYYRLTIIVFVLLLGIIGIVYAFRKLVDAPVHSLQKLLSDISTNEDARIEDRAYEPEELHQINRVLNDMVTQIKGLRIRVYEEKLAQSELEIQLLKSQISPHFLINCLSAFTSLACARKVDHDLIHRFSYVLSQHLRYTFSTKRVASLEKEFSHIDNYLELVSIRYPDSLSYRLNLPKECRKASVTPMLILTLCENSVKYNMVLGQTLRILVDAELLEKGDRQQIHITYMDSGTGYPQEVLDWNNHILEHVEQYREGQHIGIYNITRSLKLNFGELADIRFSNEPGMGARTDIYLPFEPVEE